MAYEIIDSTAGIYRSDLILADDGEGEQAWTPEVAVDLGGSWRIVSCNGASVVVEVLA